MYHRTPSTPIVPLVCIFLILIFGPYAFVNDAKADQPQPGTVADCAMTPNGDYLCENPTTTVKCAEDDPCSDCETMGNKKCGDFYEDPEPLPDYPVPDYPVPDYPVPATPTPMTPAFTG